MKAVIQRVTSASVVVEGETLGAIDRGFLILLGVHENDTEAEADLLAKKVANLRVFEDDDEKMNLSMLDCGYSALVISQFTLLANTKKGNRPSFIAAARPEVAIPLYERRRHGRQPRQRRTGDHRVRYRYLEEVNVAERCSPLRAIQTAFLLPLPRFQGRKACLYFVY